MPIFSFTSPEGKTYDITGPEGATKEQAFDMLQKSHPDAAPASASRPSTSASAMPGDPGYSVEADRANAAANREPVPERGAVGRAANYALTQGGRFDQDTAIRKLGRDAVTAAESVPLPENEGARATAQLLGAGWSGAKAVGQALGHGASGVADAAKGLYRSVTGAGSKAAREELSQSVKSGSIAKDLTAGKAASTEAALRDSEKAQIAARDKADEAVQAARVAANPRLTKFRNIRDAAAKETAGITGEFDKAPDTAATGKSLLDRVNAHVKGLKGERTSVAHAMYADSDAAMAARQEAGDTWQQSQSGKTLLKELEDKLLLDNGTLVSPAERHLLNNQVLPALRGETRVAAQPERLAEVEGGIGVVPATEREMAYSHPTVLRDELRRLRDAASGRPEEAYAAIGQQRAGDLANRLARSLEAWEPKLAEADAKYSELSGALNSTKTTLGSRVMRGEKYDHEALSADPSSIPRIFFKTPETVKQLITLSGGDVKAVEGDALEYASKQLSFTKTPAAARDWLKNNDEWLKALPDAHAKVEQRVARLEASTKRGKEAGDYLEQGAKSYAEDVKSTKAGAAKAGEGSQKEQMALRKDLIDFQEPIDRLVTNAQRGLTSSKDLPAAVRSLLKTKKMAGNNSDIPIGVVDRLTKQLNEIDKIQNSEERTRRVLKWAGAAAGVGLGGAVEVDRALFGR